jgi:hypothetical protein
MQTSQISRMEHETVAQARINHEPLEQEQEENPLEGLPLKEQ